MSAAKPPQTPQTLESMEAILAQYEPWLRKHAKFYSEGYQVPYEDMYQEGYLALLHAAESFKPEKGLCFLYWSQFYLRKRMSDFGKGFRYVVKLPKRAKHLTQTPLDDPDNPFDIPVSDPEPCEASETADQVAQLQGLIAKLPEVQQRILMARYWNEEGRMETAQALGISGEWYRVQHNAALKALRKRLEKAD